MSSGILRRPFESGRIRREGGAIPTDACTILIVDDTESSARLFQRLLTRDGHRVCVACNGAQGLDTVARDHPDPALMDVVMPTSGAAPNR